MSFFNALLIVCSSGCASERCVKAIPRWRVSLRKKSFLASKLMKPFGDYVLDGDQIVVQLFLPTSAGDIDGKGDELPNGWEKDITAMIGLKPEWVDDVEWMTGE